MGLTFLEAVGKLRDVPDTDALWRLVSRFFRESGAVQISYHRYRGLSDPGLDTSQAVTVIAEGYPEEWVAHYIRDKLFLIDPIPEAARSLHRPTYWSEVGDLMRLTPEQRDFIAEMIAAGIGDGIALHVYGPDLRNA